MNSLVSSISEGEYGNEFMKLLMIQLRYQDPLDPVSDKDFLAQMAQFSSLAELTKLNTTFSQALQIQQVNEARELMGQNITYLDTESGGALSGIVDGVKIGQNGSMLLLIGGQEVPLSNLQAVHGQ